MAVTEESDACDVAAPDEGGQIPAAAAVVRAIIRVTAAGEKATIVVVRAAGVDTADTPHGEEEIDVIHGRLFLVHFRHRKRVRLSYPRFDGHLFSTVDSREWIVESVGLGTDR